eukprot:SM000022S07152  [mRNA]  locus=s22:212984:214534:+ [translate_table: standard]
MRGAVEATSAAWARLLRAVRHRWPHFNASNGADHFGLLTLDHGRCTALAFADPDLVGDMFFLQLNGDKLVRAHHASANRSMQAITYNWGAARDPSLPNGPCYRPGRDIVIPPVVPGGVTRPWQSRRPILALFRFSPGQHHGVPIPHHGHLPRKELYDLFAKRRIWGWSFDAKSEERSSREWQQAVFCISPPGHSQWTSRPFKAILAGCIPVTFFREHDNPWQDELDYAKVSINIDPDHIFTLKDRLDAILRKPARLRAMQRSLAAIQEYFVWDEECPQGVQMRVVRALRQRARQVRGAKLAQQALQEHDGCTQDEATSWA